MMRRALEYSKLFGIGYFPLRRSGLVADGQMQEGKWSTAVACENSGSGGKVMVARDILLAQLTGGRLHLAHLSTAGSVALLRFAAEQGIAVTAEATPIIFS